MKRKQYAPKGTEFRAVPGFDGVSVSDQGDVMRRGRVLKPHLKPNGYQRVTIRRNEKLHHFYVHRLVAAAWLGECPPGAIVNHKDGNKQNNTVANLEYMTPGENVRHAYQIGLVKNYGESHYRARLTAAVVEEIRFAAASCGLSGTDMADTLSVSSRTIDDVLKMKTWRRTA